MSNPNSPQRMRFGPFLVDLPERDLRRQGFKIKLNEKPFQVLTVLLERAGHMVRREELRAHLWPADTYVDFNANLNTALSTLRHALGDSTESPIYIETVPRQGYRFIAEVTILPNPDTVVPPAQPQPAAIAATNAASNAPAIAATAQFDVTRPGAPAAEPERAGEAPRPDARTNSKKSAAASRRSYFAPTVLAALVVAALIAMLYSRHLSVATQADNRIDKATLLVAPFENVSGDASQAYLTDGVTAQLVSQLGSRFPRHLSVVDGSAGARQKDPHNNLLKLVSQQPGAYVLEGTVQRADGRINITARLLRSQDGRVFWSQNYDSDAKDLFTIERDLSERISQSLAASFPAGVEPAPYAANRSFHTVPPEAYDEYLQGQHAFYSGKYPSAVQDSEKHFQRSIDLDPQFGAPYAGLAQAYETSAWWMLGEPKEDYRLAKAAAQKALSLDDSLVDAHLILAVELYQQEWNWSAAENEFHRALAMDPSSIAGFRKYAAYLTAALRFDDAHAQLELAKKVDPSFVGITSDACMVDAMGRQYDRAIAECRQALDTYPESHTAHYYLAVSYLYTNRFQEAVDELKKTGDSDGSRSVLAIIDARKGDRVAAEKIVSELKPRAEQNYISHYALAEIYSELGDTDTALALLRRAFDEHSTDLLSLPADPDFDNVRDTLPFKQMVSQLGLPALSASAVAGPQLVINP